jgi:hypothetical protein
MNSAPAYAGLTVIDPQHRRGILFLRRPYLALIVFRSRNDVPGVSPTGSTPEDYGQSTAAGILRGDQRSRPQQADAGDSGAGNAGLVARDDLMKNSKICG